MAVALWTEEASKKYLCIRIERSPMALMSVSIKSALAESGQVRARPQPELKRSTVYKPPPFRRGVPDCLREQEKKTGNGQLYIS